MSAVKIGAVLLWIFAVKFTTRTQKSEYLTFYGVIYAKKRKIDEKTPYTLPHRT